jgi:hypothetical protein
VLVGVHPFQAGSQACRDLREDRQTARVVPMSQAASQEGMKLRGQLLQAIVIERGRQSARKVADECATGLDAHQHSTAGDAIAWA